jgi:uncharacterized protein DUF1844
VDLENIKKMEETWSKLLNKEKSEAEASNLEYHQPTFKIFVSSLGMQAMIALGKLENPLTGKVDKNLEQARFLIDTIGLVKEKTQGNRNEEENKFMQESLYNLQLLYVQEKG